MSTSDRTQDEDKGPYIQLADRCMVSVHGDLIKMIYGGIQAPIRVNGWFDNPRIYQVYTRDSSLLLLNGISVMVKYVRELE